MVSAVRWDAELDLLTSLIGDVQAASYDLARFRELGMDAQSNTAYAERERARVLIREQIKRLRELVSQ